MKIQFNTYDNLKQKLACQAWIDNNVTEINYGGAKGGGKSYLGCSLIFGDALIYAKTRYFIGRVELNDLRRYTNPTIEEVFDNFKLSKKFYTYNGQDNHYTMYNGSQVLFIPLSYKPSDPNYSRFGSMQMTRGFIEEAGETTMDPAAVRNICASVGRWKNEVYGINGKVLFTFNPSKNFMYERYKQFKDNALPGHVKFIQAFATDNHKLPSGYVDYLYSILSPNEIQRLILGNWEYDDDPDALIKDYQKLLNLFTSNLQSEGDYYITCDAARFGSDKAIILVWHGWDVIDYMVYNVSKTTEISESIIHLQNRYNIPNFAVIVDEDGIGGGVVDEVSCLGFHNGARAIRILGQKQEYDNLKVQCSFYLADVINKGILSFKTNVPENYKKEIIGELEQLKKQQTEPGKPLKIVDKAQIKKNIGRSPDWSDSLMMRSYFDIKINKPLL